MWSWFVDFKKKLVFWEVAFWGRRSLTNGSFCDNNCHRTYFLNKKIHHKMKKILFFGITTLLFSLLFSCSSNNKTLKTSSNIDLANSSSKKVIILTIDGGGIKGVIPAYFIQKIEEAKNKQAFQLFDVIGGTSTGGIISIGLTTPHNHSKKPPKAEALVNLYLDDCSNLFYPNDCFYGHEGPQYAANKSHTHGIEPFLKSFLTPNMTLSQAKAGLQSPKVKHVFTTSYIVNSTGGKISDPKMNVDFGPFLFNWADATTNTKMDYYAWEAARGTSAAPGYFPIAHVGGGLSGRSGADEKWVIDGGVMSNDPSIWGFTESLRTNIAKESDEIIVISIGCGIDRYNGGVGVTNQGTTKHCSKYQQHGFWSKLYWIDDLYNLNKVESGLGKIIDLTLYANQFVPAIQMENLAKFSPLIKYYRLQPELPLNLTAMDDCDNVQHLKTVAEEYLNHGGAGADIFKNILNELD